MKGNKGVVTVRELDWYKPCSLDAETFDVLLGSELVFEEEILHPLVNVVKYLTDRNPAAFMLLAFKCMYVYVSVRACMTCMHYTAFKPKQSTKDS